MDNTTLILSSIIAFYILKGKKTEASEVIAVDQKKTEIPMPIVTLKPIIETIPEVAVQEITVPEVEVVIPKQDQIIPQTVLQPVQQTASAMAVPILATLSPSFSNIDLLTSPSRYSQQDKITVSSAPKIQLLTTDEVSKQGVNTYKESIFYADYSIPLHSVVNRTITNDLLKKMTSFGASVYGITIPYTETISNIQMLGKVDWKSISPDVYFDIFVHMLITNLIPFGALVDYVLFKYVFSVGPVGIVYDPTPEDVVKGEVNRLMNYPKTYNITSKKGFFLGFMARNRVDSSMVPLVKIVHGENKDETYITSDMIPVVTGSGYETDGDIIGYISTIPFEDSIEVAILYNLLMGDFVLAAHGSEYERALIMNDYIPIKSIGYVSSKFKKGQQGVYAEGVEDYERVKSGYSSSLDNLFNSSGASDIRRLSKDIRIDKNSTSLLPAVNITSTAENLYKGLKIPAGPLESVALKTVGDNKITKKFNADYYGNNKVSSDSISNLYETVEQKTIPISYLGIVVPKRGEITDIITEIKDTVYKLNTSQIIIKKNTKRILVRQLDNALLEVIIDDSAGYVDTSYLSNLLVEVATTPHPEVDARRALGEFLKLINGRPVYYIDHNSKIHSLYSYRQQNYSWTV